MTIISTNKITNETIDKSVDCLINHYNKLENERFWFVFRLKIIFRIIVLIELYDEKYYFKWFYTDSNNRQRLCFLMITKCYRSIIAMNSSIIQSITDIYKCCYYIINFSIVCYVFQFQVKYLRCTTYIKHDFIVIVLSMICNLFNDCVLLIVEIIQTKTRKKSKYHRGHKQ